MDRRYDIVTVIGAGLLGASIGLGMKSRGLAGRIRGVGHRQSTLDAALARGAIDESYLDPVEAAKGAGLIAVCTPAALVPTILDQIRPVCRPDVVVTDVASTKAVICAHAARSWPSPRRFVGSHPMAGSEKFGPEHATPDLYHQSVTIVEPRADHAPDAWDATVALWRSLGSSVAEIDPCEHDALVARTSHVPHVAAACLARLAAEKGDVRAVAGRGFRDTTRIASGRAEVWRDICLTNDQAITEGLERLIAQLGDVKRWITAHDGVQLDRFFREAQDARAQVVQDDGQIHHD